MRLVGIGALQSIARWLELLALGVYVFDLTRSAFAVAVVTLLKVAPLALFGPLFGVLAARLPPRRLYLSGLLVMLMLMLVGSLLASHAGLALWQVWVISFAGGVFWVLDFPIRRTALGNSVPAGLLGRAMAVDTIANNGTRMLGPVAGGLLLQFAGLQGAFLIALLLYLVCLILTWRLDFPATQDQHIPRNSVAGEMRIAFSVVQKNPVVLATLLVTVMYNLFLFPMLSLIPVLGRDELVLSASAIGLLSSMEGAGALIGGLLLMRFGRVLHYRRTYLYGLAFSFFWGVVFALAPQAVLVGTALLMVGVGTSFFAAMQTTLLIMNLPSHYHSQVLGLLSLAIGTGLIGFSQIGVMASWLGTRPALWLSASLGLLSLMLIRWRWPEISASQPARVKQHEPA